jgi:hypothetical protein
MSCEHIAIYLLEDLMKARSQRLITIFFLLSVTASAQTGGKPNLPPMQIKEQGSFAIGGTIINNPGKFDPYRPTPDGQTLHGDHA